MLPTETLNGILVLYDGRDGDAREISEAISGAGDGPAGVFDGGAATAVNGAVAAAVSLVDVSGIAVRDCCGCFGCWIRTPGLCVFTGDEGNELCGRVMESQAVVFVSRITWGGYSAAIKTIADRMLPLLHPDFVRVNGAMHHRMRYSRMPRLLAVGYGAASAAEEETFTRYTEAHRINFGSSSPDGESSADFTDNSAGATTIWQGDTRAFRTWLATAIPDQATGPNRTAREVSA